jgi:hypothetical protein
MHSTPYDVKMVRLRSVNCTVAEESLFSELYNFIRNTTILGFLISVECSFYLVLSTVRLYLLYVDIDIDYNRLYYYVSHAVSV